MAFKKVAEISIDKLEDRKTVTAILHANGYTVGPGKRKKTPTGKQLDYYLKVYKEVEEDGNIASCAIGQRASLLADMDTEEDISSAKIKKQRGCREKLLEIRCRVL